MTPENFKDHPLFEKINQFSFRTNEQEALEKIPIENQSFFQACIKYISDRLRITIPILVQETEMSAMLNEIDASLQQINTFLGNNNIGHIQNATNNLQSALNRIRNFPFAYSEGDFDFAKAAASFEQILTEKYNFLEAEKNRLAEEIKNQKEDLEAKDLEISRLFRLVEVKENEIQNLNSQFQSEFSAFKSRSSQEIETDRTIFRREIDTDRESFRKEIEELKNSIDTDTSDTIKTLKTKLEEAEKIVSVIGNIGVTGNYQIIANEHRETANRWRLITILFMTAFSGLLVWTIIDLSSTGFDWLKSLIRIIAAAALSYPATYAARESSRHRKLETINRTAELELASLNPFIELLPKEKQQSIKEKLVEKYFGNGNTETIIKANEDETLSIGGWEKILKAVGGMVKK